MNLEQFWPYAMIDDLCYQCNNLQQIAYDDNDIYLVVIVKILSIFC